MIFSLLHSAVHAGMALCTCTNRVPSCRAEADVSESCVYSETRPDQRMGQRGIRFGGQGKYAAAPLTQILSSADPSLMGTCLIRRPQGARSFSWQASSLMSASFFLHCLHLLQGMR